MSSAGSRRYTTQTRQGRLRPMAIYEHLRDLPLTIDDYGLEPLRLDVSSEFTRHTTVIRLRGDGHEGVGEDVTYDAEDQLALQEEGPTLPLAGSHTIDSFSQLVDRLSLFPGGPSRDDWVNYRRWAYESAALDLALRQAGRRSPPRPAASRDRSRSSSR